MRLKSYYERPLIRVTTKRTKVRAYQSYYQKTKHAIHDSGIVQCWVMVAYFEPQIQAELDESVLFNQKVVPGNVE